MQDNCEEIIEVKAEEIRNSLQKESENLQNLDKAIAVVNSIAQLEGLVTESLRICNSIYDSYLSYKEIELKFHDNKDRRNNMIMMFRESNNILYLIINNFLDKIDNASDDKSKDRYANLLIQAMSKSENITMGLLKIL